jgi:hypothetical protein
MHPGNPAQAAPRPAHAMPFPILARSRISSSFPAQNLSRGGKKDKRDGR